MRQLKLYLLMAVLLALLPTSVFAGDGSYEFSNKNNFKVTYDPSTYTFSFALMVHANAAVNGFLPDTNPGILEISHDGKTWETIAKFWGKNYDEQTTDGIVQETFVSAVSSTFKGEIVRSDFTGTSVKYDSAYASST